MKIAHRPRVLVLWLFTLATAAVPLSFAQDAGEGGNPPRARAKAAARKGGPPRASVAEKKAATLPDDAPQSADDSTPAEPAADGPSFAREVAPILVANCIDCHSGDGRGLSRGKLNMGTFESLMKGGAGGVLTEVGEPEKSHLILRVTGEEEPRMPPGNDARLGPQAVALLENWVKAGAKLDAGLDPKAPIKSYAASLDEVKRSQIAQMSPDERDAQIKETALARWKRANPDLAPEMETTEHFALFSTLPQDRAAAAVKAMESQLPTIRKILGPEAANWSEKVSLYVFSDRKDYIEFLRTVRGREADDESGDADLRTAQPYVVVHADENAAAPQAASAKSRRSRGRRDAEPESSGRTLNGLLAENLSRGAVLANGSSPRWLADGVGSFVSSLAERRSLHHQSLRRAALGAYERGWPTQATEVLGGGEQISPAEFQGVSFGLVECLTSPRFRNFFPAFVQGMSGGANKFDEVVESVYGATREDFLNETGEWIAATYGGYQ